MYEHLLWPVIGALAASFALAGFALYRALRLLRDVRAEVEDLRAAVEREEAAPDHRFQVL